MKLKINNKLITIIFSSISFLTIIICLICNFLINHTLSWSLIVLFSILLCYFIILPSLILPKKKKLLSSLICLTIFIIPYFFILNLLLTNFNIFKIGSISSLITLIYLWCTFFVYQKLRNKGFKGAAVELLITAIFSLAINTAITLILSTNTFNFSNIICIIILLIFSLICFIYDYRYKE